MTSRLALPPSPSTRLFNQQSCDHNTIIIPSDCIWRRQPPTPQPAAHTRKTQAKTAVAQHMPATTVPLLSHRGAITLQQQAMAPDGHAEGPAAPGLDDARCAAAFLACHSSGRLAAHTGKLTALFQQQQLVPPPTAFGSLQDTCSLQLSPQINTQLAAGHTHTCTRQHNTPTPPPDTDAPPHPLCRAAVLPRQPFTLSTPTRTLATFVLAPAWTFTMKFTASPPACKSPGSRLPGGGALVLSERVGGCACCTSLCVICLFGFTSDAPLLPYFMSSLAGHWMTQRTGPRSS